MSSKYSREFKLKVLEYYFEHGGDKKFGNKARTANHFCIDHKTVSRMLCNPEMVKKARKMLGKKSGCSTENASKSSKPNIKIGQPFVSVEKIVGSATQRIGSPSSSSTKSPKKFHTPQRLSETPVIELPEDPDFSVLKSSIDTSVSSVPHVARLLVTGNHEVKYIIANECDLIFECKVCRNLFRSVINFLAHKRIYCLDRYSSVRNLFNKDMASNMTTESETVFVEPEPPPPSSPAQKDSPPPVVQVAQENVEVSESAAPLNKIDQIAALLAKKGKEKGDEEPLSSATHKGSSEYFNRIENINNARKSMGTDCTVVLQDIKDVSCAVYQSVFPRNNNPVTPRKTSHQRKRVRPVQLDSEGKVVEKKEKEHGKKIQPPVPKKVPVINKKKEEIETDVPCKSCNSVFPSKKMLNTHVEEVHGLERMVYTCPICNVIFLSIWGCIKHLIRIHKKKRHHRERLKHVICSRAYKKVFTAKEIAKHSHKSCAEIPKAGESKTDASSSKETPHSHVSSQGLMEEEREMDKLGSSDKAKESSNSRVFISGTEEESPGHSRNKVSHMVCSDSQMECEICGKRFASKTSRLTHQQSHVLILDGSKSQPNITHSAVKLRSVKLKRRSRNKEKFIKASQKSNDQSCESNLTRFKEVNETTCEGPAHLISNSNTSQVAVPSQEAVGSSTNCSMIKSGNLRENSRELGLRKKESLSYSTCFRRYDVGCSFFRNFEFEQNFNSEGPVDFLFSKVEFKPSLENIGKQSCITDVDKTVKHVKNSTTLEVNDDKILLWPQYILPHTNNHEESSVKLESNPDLSSLHELDITLQPYFPLVKESDECEVKEEALDRKELELPDVIKEEYCVETDKPLEDTILNGLKTEICDSDISDKMEEKKSSISDKDVLREDFDKENIPKHSISNDTENPELKQLALLSHESQRSKLPVLVIKKSGSSENNSDEWLVSKEKSLALEAEKHTKAVDLKAKNTRSVVSEKKVDGVDISNSNLTLKFKRVEKLLSSEYEVVSRKSNEEKSLANKQVGKSKVDVTRPDIPSRTCEKMDVELKSEKLTNTVPPLILFKKGNSLNKDTVIDRKRTKSSDGTLFDEHLNDENVGVDDTENLSVKMYPKVSYTAKRHKTFHISSSETPHLDFIEKDNALHSSHSNSLSNRLQLHNFNKTFALQRSQNLQVPKCIDLKSPFDSEIITSGLLLESVRPLSDLTSTSPTHESFYGNEDDNVTVKDLDLHSNVSFGKLSFSDTSCMPSDVLNYSKKNPKKS